MQITRLLISTYILPFTGHHNVVEMLMIHSKALNINLEAKNSQGQSAKDLAFSKKSKRVLELLTPTPGFAWKKSCNGEHVVGAVGGGADPDAKWYVGRADHHSDLLPGKVYCKDGELYVPWGEKFLYTDKLFTLSYQ